MKTLGILFFLAVVVGGIYLAGMASSLPFLSYFKEASPQEQLMAHHYRIAKSETTIPFLRLIDGTKPCQDDDYMVFEATGKVMLHRGEVACEHQELQEESVYEWSLSPNGKKLTLTEGEDKTTFEVMELSDKKVAIKAKGEALMGLMDTETNIIFEVVD